LRISCMVFLIAIMIPNLHSQVFEVGGGASSLYQAQGGTLAAHGPSYDASIGAGIVAGKFVGGANLTKMVGRSTYILGDDYIRFQLPTDIFDTSHYLVAQGAGVKTTLGSTKIFAFAGATSTEFNSPLFEGARAENPAGIVFLSKRLAPSLEASSKMVFSRQTTAIQSLEWQPAEKLKLAVSGGVGANQPYGAASLEFSRPWIDLKAAYIEAGSQFHRVAVETPLLSEPDRENVQVTVRPAKFISFSGGRQNFLTPLSNSQTNVRSSIDQVSGNLEVEGTGLTASLYHSTYLGESNNSTAYTVGRDFFSRVHTTASYLESRPNDAPRTRSFVANFSEVLSPRWNVNEVVNRSQGQTTVSFGGGFLSNLFSISADYETYYIPQRNSSPFEQALILDVQMHLFRGITLHGATFVAPDGSLRYTADAHALLARDGMIRGSNEEDTLERAAMGTMLLRGRVIDTKGNPIAGAALMLDQLVVYTNDDGLFYVRERKPHTHQLKVLVDRFLGGGVYRVISAPATTRSGYEENTPEIEVIVQQLAPAAP
jgi:hypothetical protein